MATSKEIHSRLEMIMARLFNGEALSSKDVSTEMNLSSKTVTRYIKEKLASSYIYNDIQYDAKTKKWQAKNINKTETILTDEEQFIINVLEKYTHEQGHEFRVKANIFFEKYKQNISNSIYTKVFAEDINERLEDLLLIEQAIKKSKIITMDYNSKHRKLQPYKIVNFDGYWYLIALNISDNKIKNFYFKKSSNVKMLDDSFTAPSQDMLEKINKGINAYFDYESEEIEVILLVDKEIASIFNRIKLNPSQRIMRTNSDGSLEVSICITHEMEIVPFIQKWIPYIKVIEPESIQQTISDNIKKFNF
ncbi:MAG: WYL domain-containing protein [Sulfurimonas sp.]|jgi:predicted DNA-binding transcriptional regulator YafY